MSHLSKECFQMNAFFRSFIVISIGILTLTSCAAVYTDASDANHVTFLNSSGESMDQLTNKASAYCAQYGKTASYKSSDTQLLVVFNCNPSR